MHLGVVVVLSLCLCTSAEWTSRAAATGVNYAYNLPPESHSPTAEAIVKSVTSQGARLIRLRDADSTTLRALGGLRVRGRPIEVIIGLTNEELVVVGLSPSSARSWVSMNVLPYFPRTNIVAIAVGSDVLTSEDESSLVPFLVPAVRNIHSALVEMSLGRRIKVSAPQSSSLLSACLPSSSAVFRGDHQDRALGPLLEFLSSSGSFFMLDILPADLVRAREEVSPALTSESRVNDPVTGRHFANVYDVVIKALRVALASSSHQDLEITVTNGEWSLSTEDGSSKPNLIDHEWQVAAVDPGMGVEKRSSNPLSESLSGTLSSRRFLGTVGTIPEENARRKLADKSWCIAKSDADLGSLQSALDWACGPGHADCSAIQSGQTCFLPNTVVAHASYAFNSYYQSQSWATGSCDFGGLAYVTNSDPSSASCLYKSSTTADGSPGTPTGTTYPPSASSTLKRNRLHFILTSCVLVFLINRVLRKEGV